MAFGLNTSGAGNSTNGASPQGMAATVPSYTGDGLLLAWVHGVGLTVTALSWNSSSMTLLGSIAGSFNQGIYLFALSNPAAATNDFSVSWTGADSELRIMWQLWEDVDTTSPYGSAYSALVSTTNLTAGSQTSTGALTAAGVSLYEPTGGYPQAGTGMTVSGTYVVSDVARVFGYRTTSGEVNFTLSTATSNSSIIGVGVASASGGGSSSGAAAHYYRQMQ